MNENWDDEDEDGNNDGKFLLQFKCCFSLACMGVYVLVYVLLCLVDVVG